MIESILFDLGGVFIDVDPKRSVSLLVKQLGKFSEEDIHEFLYHSELNRRFEKGLVDPQAFHQYIINEWKTEFSFDFFKTIWNDIFKPIQSMVDLLPKFKKYYPLLCVSNTNVLHIEYIRNQMSLLDYFDHLIFSYEVGYVKPEPEIYLEALKKAQSQPQACLFVDDRYQNVQAAEKMGMDTIHFSNYRDFMNQIEKRQLIH